MWFSQSLEFLCHRYDVRERERVGVPPVLADPSMDLLAPAPGVESQGLPPDREKGDKTSERACFGEMKRLCLKVLQMLPKS